MIYYLLSSKNIASFKQFLGSWGKPFARFIQPISYKDFAKQRLVPHGTYIFSDLDSLTPKGLETMARIWEKLAAAKTPCRLLNHPLQVMHRYELLRTLYERGINRFNVYRFTETQRPERYPVFIRGETDHRLPLTSLLHDPEALRKAADELQQQGHQNLLIVEFCDTSDPKGIFRKYSAIKIGDRIIPRYILFGREWMQKYWGLTTEEFGKEERHARELSEEEAYVHGNPHELELRKIFELARIDYGRIDYGLLDGQIQVWEINLNSPITGLPDSRFGRGPIFKHVFRQISSAFQSVDWSPFHILTMSSQSL